MHNRVGQPTRPGVDTDVIPTPEVAAVADGKVKNFNVRVSLRRWRHPLRRWRLGVASCTVDNRRRANGRRAGVGAHPFRVVAGVRSRSPRNPARCKLISEDMPGVAVGAGIRRGVSSRPRGEARGCRGRLQDDRRERRPTRVLSIIAGVTTRALDYVALERAGRDDAVAMPDAPALVGAGASASPAVREPRGDLDWAESILGSVGMVVRVDEKSLDAVTGLSGSGPTYVFRLTEALALAGEKAGLSPRRAVLWQGRPLSGRDDFSRALRRPRDSERTRHLSGGNDSGRPGRTRLRRSAPRAVLGRRRGRHQALDRASARVNSHWSRQFPLSATTTLAYIGHWRRGVIQLTSDEPTSPRYLTVREVATSLRVSTMTVYRLINGGNLPAVRIGKSFRVLEDDLNRYLSERYTQAV